MNSPALELLFLGTGTSVGVPMVGCSCQTCLSPDPRDKRCRSSVWMSDGAADWLVDTGPDLRFQCLRADIRKLDAAIFTHAHMDHVAGFDELRRFTVAEDRQMPVHATAACMATLCQMFEYAFNGQNRYRGYLKPDPRPINGPFQLGRTTVTPLPVSHGKVETIGFLFQREGRSLCAYIPDCKELSEGAVEAIRGVDTLVLDALRHTPHPTHLNLPEALAMVAAIHPRQTWLTHFQCEILHARDDSLLPPGVNLAYDGLRLRWNI
jgi:phosphoribosyl 1,2-cyclic phosphate phosphodiesterase